MGNKNGTKPGVKLSKKSIATHTCPLCGIRLAARQKLAHFKAVHPEYKISRFRVDADHTAYKCDVCGQTLSNFGQVIKHFAASHPYTDTTPGDAWLDSLLERLEQRKALLVENKRLNEENKQLKQKNKELTEKIVRAQVLMSQPER
jgi:predicted RNA-binding Zn-ribbon protein involved in translation (DUF1610 family)